MAFFEGLVGRFYDRVAGDPILRPLYPETDDALPLARRRLTLFLAQYWGGPTTYDEERGHPRLRMRHAPFAIGPAERDAWLRLMPRRWPTRPRGRTWPTGSTPTSSWPPTRCATATERGVLIARVPRRTGFHAPARPVSRRDEADGLECAHDPVEPG